MKKNLILFHLFCFVIVGSSVTFFLFYQLFITPQGHKLPITQFIAPRVFSSAVHKLISHEIMRKEEAIFFQKDDVIMKNNQIIAENTQTEVDTQIFFIESKKYITSINAQTLHVRDVDTNQEMKIPLPNQSVYTILGWINEHEALLSQKGSTFTFLKANLLDGSLEILVDNVVYPFEFQPVISGKLTSFIYPSCDPHCYLHVFDLTKKETTRQLPVFTDAGHGATVSDAKLLFYDITKGYVGYEVVGRQEIFVIDMDLNLLQLIRLKNDRNTARYVGYYAQTQQMLFSLEENDQTGQMVVLVRANTPSVHVLQQTEKINPIQTSLYAGVYQKGDELFDLNGKQLQQVVGEILSSY